jgi:hypothetical protein
MKYEMLRKFPLITMEGATTKRLTWAMLSASVALVGMASSAVQMQLYCPESTQITSAYAKSRYFDKIIVKKLKSWKSSCSLSFQ